MTRKENCDNCQKKWDKNSDENWYIIKYYHGQSGRGVIWACSTCYPTKEQEYLQNYQVIYRRRFRDKDGDIDYEVIKGNIEDCYASKKDQNGKVLWQENCSHCQPWKQHQEDTPKPTKICSVCGKDITNKGGITYSSKSSSGKKKDFCSIDCLQQNPKPQQQKPLKNNNKDNKGLSIEMKVFLGIMETIIVIIIVIMVVRISRKTKK